VGDVLPGRVVVGNVLPGRVVVEDVLPGRAVVGSVLLGDVIVGDVVVVLEECAVHWFPRRTTYWIFLPQRLGPCWPIERAFTNTLNPTRTPLTVQVRPLPGTVHFREPTCTSLRMIFDEREESWRTTTTTSLVPAERCTVLTRTMVGAGGTTA
jgi:hypothetical protein